MKGLRAAASLLTRANVGRRDELQTMAGAAPWFPVVGAAVGLAVAGVYAAARIAFPSLLASCIAVAFGIWITGAFHEDGLADTADGFGGRRSREEVLHIMGDPRLGTYGVTALALDVILRVGSVAALDGWSALVIIPTAHAISRAAAVLVSATERTARDEGSAATYRSHLTRREVVICTAVAVAIGVVALGAVAVVAIGAAALTTTFLARLARRRIDGLTGDVLGAVQQTAEIAVLLVGVAALRAGALDVPFLAGR